jgi:[pyruvate, water dikinase]-phosphate phosphotransferase / [pyruvate, water dikinase] kinase
MKKFHLHLVSDSTGETVCSVARAAIVQFEGVDAEEHVWALVRSKTQIEKVIAGIKEKPGIVMYTIVGKELRDILGEACAKLGVPCIPVLSRVIADLSTYLNMKISPQPGRQHELDEDYFSRVEAINFTLSHDDGQATWDINEADIILVGASRTSKSPTCVYLAYRGYRAANVPFVMGCPLPDTLLTATHPLIVGLTIGSDRLIQIRKNRLLALHENNETDYVDSDAVKEEIAEARKLFMRNNWPIIDVTRRSVEETAATIIQLYQDKKSTQAAHIIS